MNIKTRNVWVPLNPTVDRRNPGVMNIWQFSYCCDGRNTAPVDKVVYRGIYKALYTPGGAGFVPSTVGPRLSCLSIGNPDFFDITPHPGIWVL